MTQNKTVDEILSDEVSFLGDALVSFILVTHSWQKNHISGDHFKNSNPHITIN